MIATTREERTGRDLMDRRDFATIVKKISDTYDVAPYDASIALDQAIAFVMTVAAVSTFRRENLWVSVPVDNAWRTWLTNPLQYSKIAPIAGGYVDRILMMDPADPGQLIRTAEVIQEQRFATHREAWYGQAGASAIGIVKARLVTPASA
jgi:hypothetical protein